MRKARKMPSNLRLVNIQNRLYINMLVAGGAVSLRRTCLCWGDFPVKRENTGNIRLRQPERPGQPVVSASKSICYAEIPYLEKQGISSR
jgi:hypothetical protein